MQVEATGKYQDTAIVDMLNTILTTLRGTVSDDADDSGYNFANARRRSNSSTGALNDFKTKFEQIDQEPVFEEELHGPTDDDYASTLSKEDTNSSNASEDSEEGVKRM